MKVEDVDYFGLSKKRYLAKGAPKQGVLTEEEKDLLVEVADFVRGKSAKAISDISHTNVWAMAELGEELPYYTALSLWPPEILDADREWALETAREHASERPN